MCNGVGSLICDRDRVIVSAGIGVPIIYIEELRLAVSPIFPHFRVKPGIAMGLSANSPFGRIVAANAGSVSGATRTVARESPRTLAREIFDKSNLHIGFRL